MRVYVRVCVSVCLCGCVHCNMHVFCESIHTHVCMILHTCAGM